MPDWINNLLWLLIGAFAGATIVTTIICIKLKWEDTEDE